MAFYEKEVAEREPLPGVVTGLAYSGSGNGGILFIESTKMPGHGDLQLTGTFYFRSSLEAVCSTNSFFLRFIGRCYQRISKACIDLGQITRVCLEDCDRRER